MNDEHRVDAVLYALGQLGASEAHALIEAADQDPELAALITEYHATLGVFALSAEPIEPPARLRDSILAIAAPPSQALPETPIDPPARIVPPAPVLLPTPTKPEPFLLREVLPWCLAASLAIGCAVLASIVATLHRENQVLLASRDDWSSWQLAILAPSDPAQSQASGRAIWNQQMNAGVFESDSLPALTVAQVYQLWVFEKDNPAPIPAGFFDPAEGRRAELKPTRAVGTISAVAVSIETPGGRLQPKGPVVLVGAVGKAG